MHGLYKDDAEHEIINLISNADTHSFQAAKACDQQKGKSKNMTVTYDKTKFVYQPNYPTGKKNKWARRCIC